MPKNFLMIADITRITALSWAIYVILRNSYYFQATFSFQGRSAKIFIGLYNWKIRLRI